MSGLEAHVVVLAGRARGQEPGASASSAPAAAQRLGRLRCAASRRGVRPQHPPRVPPRTCRSPRPTPHHPPASGDKGAVCTRAQLGGRALLPGAGGAGSRRAARGGERAGPSAAQAPEAAGPECPALLCTESEPAPANQRRPPGAPGPARLSHPRRRPIGSRAEGSAPQNSSAGQHPLKNKTKK